MPMFRGLKKALREQHHEQRVLALMDDQRCREHVYNEAIREARSVWEAPGILEACLNNARNDYHRLPPVKPYENCGPQSNFHKATP